MIRRALLLAVCGLLLLGATAGAAAKRTISILGTSQNGGIVTVSVKVSGWKMYPKLVGKKTRTADGGHWHIYVDGTYNAFSANAKSGRTTKLSDGKHALYVELANNDHSSLKPRVRSQQVSVAVAGETDAGTNPPPTSPPYDDPYGP
jgi:hypothetical protein